MYFGLNSLSLSIVFVRLSRLLPFSGGSSSNEKAVDLQLLSISLIFILFFLFFLFVFRGFFAHEYVVYPRAVHRGYAEHEVVPFYFFANGGYVLEQVEY